MIQCVSLLFPGKVYRRSRFDWTGIIDQITLSGIPFLGLEANGHYRGTGGLGLSSEFDIESPPGYETALPGDHFILEPGDDLKWKRHYSFEV